VCILPDNDDAGRKHAERIAPLRCTAGRIVRVVAHS
jgi:hypothetical protein